MALSVFSLLFSLASPPGELDVAPNIFTTKPPAKAPTASPTQTPGCAVTQYGCCADGVTAKASEHDSCGGVIFDDPHATTLSGNKYFLHGVGVFDYASIPGKIKSQIYLCPGAKCTSESMSSGDCLTYVQAVAVQFGVGPKNHTVVL